MKRPLIADLFCGAGLVYDGLCEAGLQPVGIDLEPQPLYPGPFIQMDIMDVDDRLLDLFPYAWASPPCLKETVLHASARREQEAHGVDLTDHNDLITPTQALLDRWAARTGGLFTIENVSNTRLLRNPQVLCGSMFSLGAYDRGVRYRLERHRKVETNWPLVLPEHKHSADPVVGVYGGHARIRSAMAGGRKSAEGWSRPGIDIMHDAMGLLRRLPGKAIDQGVPPAYAHFVAMRMRAHDYTRRHVAVADARIASIRGEAA